MSRAAGAGLLLALATAGGLPACAVVEKVSASSPTPPVNLGEWGLVRANATRRAYIYDRFSHHATATATYLSAPVREAQVRRLSLWLGWTAQETDARLAKERAEAQKYEEFLLSFYTSESKANDLDAPTSVWRLALKLEAGDVVTRDATEVEPDANVTGLFPYVSPFDVVYRVRFPKVPGTPLDERIFRFEIASALGKMELRFNDGTLGPERPEGTPLPGK